MSFACVLKIMVIIIKLKTSHYNSLNGSFSSKPHTKSWVMLTRLCVVLERAQPIPDPFKENSAWSIVCRVLVVYSGFCHV